MAPRPADVSAKSVRTTGDLFVGLVDDAGLFPPEELGMNAAIARHRQDSARKETVLTHRFVCPAHRLGELRSALRPDDHLRLSVISQFEPAAVESVVAEVAADRRLSLAAIEGVVPTDRWASAGQIREARKAVPAAVPVFLEVPVLADPVPALEVLAANGLGAKVRCGGVRGDLFPSVEQLAAVISGCVRLGVPFKATAGLHRAIRSRDRATGWMHHGFLNLVLAVARAGSGRSDITQVLGSVDATALQEEARNLDAAAARLARSIFVSYGSCSTADPVDDLVALGLIPDNAHGRPEGAQSVSST